MSAGCDSVDSINHLSSMLNRPPPAEAEPAEAEPADLSTHGFWYSQQVLEPPWILGDDCLLGKEFEKEQDLYPMLFLFLEYHLPHPYPPPHNLA